MVWSNTALIGYGGLLVLMIQNTVQTLLMRYSRIRDGDMFISSTAVCMSELIKGLSCLLIIFFQEMGLKNCLGHLYISILAEPLDCLKISVPAFLYVIQNNLLYIAATHLNAAKFQVTYQLKLLTTTVFSVVIMQKQLSYKQWFSLFLLFIGISMVNIPNKKTFISPSVPTKIEIDHSDDKQSELYGLAAVIVACILSGFSGVYFEKLLKSTPQSVFLRNFQLGFLGFFFSLGTCYLRDWDEVTLLGFFYGYDFVVWSVVFLLALGGLIVAVVIKYTDNILKGFATSGSIILACIASIFLFNFFPTLIFILGTIMVILSIGIYTSDKPLEKNIKKMNVVKDDYVSFFMTNTNERKSIFC